MQSVDDHFSLIYFTLFVGCWEFNQTCLPYHPSRPSGWLFCRCSLHPSCFLCFRRRRNVRHRKPLTVMAFDDLKWLKKNTRFAFASGRSGSAVFLLPVRAHVERQTTNLLAFFLLLYGLFDTSSSIPPMKTFHTCFSAMRFLLFSSPG